MPYLKNLYQTCYKLVYCYSITKRVYYLSSEVTENFTYCSVIVAAAKCGGYAL